MASKSDLIRVQHMLENARIASEYCASTSRAQLTNNLPGQSHLIRSLEIIGEAANQTGQKFRNRYTQVPWRRIIAMRHRLVHAYYDINLDIIWETATQWLPALIEQLETIVAAETKTVEGPDGDEEGKN